MAGEHEPDDTWWLEKGVESRHGYLARLFQPWPHRKKKTVSKLYRPGASEGLAGLMPLSVLPLMGSSAGGKKKGRSKSDSTSARLQLSSFSRADAPQRDRTRSTPTHTNTAIDHQTSTQSYMNPAFVSSQDDVGKRSSQTPERVVRRAGSDVTDHASSNASKREERRRSSEGSVWTTAASLSNVNFDSKMEDSSPS